MLSTSRQQNAIVIKITLDYEWTRTQIYMLQNQTEQKTDIISREYSIDDHFSESLFERYKSRKHSSAVRNSSTSAMRLGAVYYSIAKPKITLPQSHVAATAREPWRDVLELKPQSMWSESHSPAARATPQWPKALTRCKPERWDLDYLKPQDRRRWALAESSSQGQLWTSSEQVLPKKATCHTFNLSCRSTPAVTGHRTAQ